MVLLLVSARTVGTTTPPAKRVVANSFFFVAEKYHVVVWARKSGVAQFLFIASITVFCGPPRHDGHGVQSFK